LPSADVFLHPNTELPDLSQFLQQSQHCEVEQTFASNDYPHFDDILAIFLNADTPIDAACFGIAGPIVDQRCQTTNLPWIIDARELAAKLGTCKVKSIRV
jgi:glucokinase